MIIKEHDDILIHPQKGKKEKELPAEAILVPNPSEAAMAVKLFGHDEVEERFLYNSKLLVDRKLRLCIAGPCLGSPAAGLVIEKLIALGVSSVTLFSCCGAIDPALVIGDAVVAVSGVVGEGTSGYYGGTGHVCPYGEGTERLKLDLADGGILWKESTIWSTDAPYREGRSELDKLREDHGVGGVDMEFSALCSIVSLRKVNLAGLFVVSDELWGDEWNPGFTRKEFRQKRVDLLSHLISCKLKRVKDDEKNL